MTRPRPFFKDATEKAAAALSDAKAQASLFISEQRKRLADHLHRDDLRYQFAMRNRPQSEAWITDRQSVTQDSEDVFRCTVAGKFALFVPENDIGFGHHMRKEGYWEFWLTKHIIETVKAGDHVLDIGANLGYYSVIMADLVGPGGRLDAAEPNPAIFDLLSRSIAENGFTQRTRLHNIALSDVAHEQAAHFCVPYGEPKNGTLLPPEQDPAYLADVGDVFTVKLGRLDPAQFSKLDFVKIDVEGAELAVLSGLWPLLDRYRPKMIVEMNFARGYSFEDVVSIFQGQADFSYLDFESQLNPFDAHLSRTQNYAEDWLLSVDWRDTAR
jgi:FkbM family methyltransferase